MLRAKWKEYCVADIEGLTDASGTVYSVGADGFAWSREAGTPGWLHASVLASRELFGGRYRVRVGEVSAHGSIGFVVLEETESQNLIWSLVSMDSNPFDQIEVKGGFVLALSTSGSVFRFRAELEHAALFLA